VAILLLFDFEGISTKRLISQRFFKNKELVSNKSTNIGDFTHKIAKILKKITN